MSNRTPDQLLSIYQLSDFYEMDEEHRQSFAALSIHPDFDPAHKLFAASTLGVSQWTRPAIDQLLNRLPHRWTNAQRDWLAKVTVNGYPCHLRLAELMCRIYNNRLVVATVGADVEKHDACRSHEKCVEAWTIAWRNGFLPHWLHPTTPCTEASAQQLLAAAHLDMSATCRALTQTKIDTFLANSPESKWKDELADSIVTGSTTFFAV